MRTSSTLAALATALMGFPAACGKGDSSGSGGGGGGPSGTDASTPQAAMKMPEDAFTSMDLPKLEACYTAEAWTEGKMKKEIEEMKKEGMSVSISWTDADIKVEGDKAVVSAKMKFKMKNGKEEQENEKFYMVKVDGKWRFTSK
jgi:hypothetical protein